jgi:hypothetical protein
MKTEFDRAGKAYRGLKGEMEASAKKQNAMAAKNKGLKQDNKNLRRALKALESTVEET